MPENELMDAVLTSPSIQSFVRKVPKSSISAAMAEYICSTAFRVVHREEN